MTDFYTHDPETYTHPREKWDEKECAKRAAYAPANHFGDKRPPGLVNSVSSSYPEYGQTVRFNGGREINGKWYQNERVLLPTIPDSYEFVPLSSWGLRIQKKTTP